MHCGNRSPGPCSIWFIGWDQKLDKATNPEERMASFGSVSRRPLGARERLGLSYAKATVWHPLKYGAIQSHLHY
jgi:hypothetical protein